MFKNKNLAKIITHKYTLYFMYFLALLNGVNYFKKQKIYCALIAIAFFLLSNKFLTKNKALSIFYSLFLANFVLGCGKIIEGHKAVGDDTDTNDKHTHFTIPAETIRTGGAAEGAGGAAEAQEASAFPTAGQMRYLSPHIAPSFTAETLGNQHAEVSMFDPPYFLGAEVSMFDPPAVKVANPEYQSVQHVPIPDYTTYRVSDEDARIHRTPEDPTDGANLSVAEAQVTPAAGAAAAQVTPAAGAAAAQVAAVQVAAVQAQAAAQGNNQAEQPTAQGTQAQQQPRQVSGQATGAGGPGVSPVAPTKTTGPGVSPVAHRQEQSTHTHTKQVVLITASVVASALALIVASGAIFLVNKKKF